MNVKSGFMCDELFVKKILSKYFLSKLEFEVGGHIAFGLFMCPTMHPYLMNHAC